MALMALSSKIILKTMSISEKFLAVACAVPLVCRLSQLISYAKPHRLLIEPTGVGHPKEVLATLQQPYYQDMFAMQATLTLVDARTVAQSRYRENAIYQEQLSIADVIIATKTDLYKGDEQTQLKAYLEAQGLTNTPLLVLKEPLKDLAIFGSAQRCAERQRSEKEHEQAKIFSQYPQHALPHGSTHDTSPDWQRTLEETGAVMIENTAQGFYSQGWVFSGSKIFNFKKVMNVLSGIEADRLKAVMITEKGIFGFNKVDNALTCDELDECSDSRLEIIDTQPDRVTTAVRKLQNTLFAQEA